MLRHPRSMERLLSWLGGASLVVVVALSSPAIAQQPTMSMLPPIRIAEVTGVEREAVVALLEPMRVALARCGVVEDYSFVIRFDGRLTDVRFDSGVAPRWARCARRALQTLRYPAGPGSSSLTSRQTIEGLLPPPTTSAPSPASPALPIELTTHARVVEGPLAADEASTVVERAAPALRESLSVRARADDLPATIELDLHVSANGTIASASVTAGPDRLASIALGAARRWRFPAHDAASTVHVTLVVSPHD